MEDDRGSDLVDPTPRPVQAATAGQLPDDTAVISGPGGPVRPSDISIASDRDIASAAAATANHEAGAPSRNPGMDPSAPRSVPPPGWLAPEHIRIADSGGPPPNPAWHAGEAAATGSGGTA